MIKLIMGLIPKPWVIVGVLAIAAGAYASLLVYGSVKYNQGAESAVQKFLKADREGAKDVRKTANEILSNLTDDTDFIGLLTNTNGLRD